MLSAVLLATGEDPPPPEARELAIRSLVWLVSAVVAGTVRDVVAACPPSWPIADAMDQAGCELVIADTEAGCVSGAAARVKCDRVLLLRIGYRPEGPLAAELDAIVSRPSMVDALTILETPSRWRQRLFPSLAPAVGLLLPRQSLVRASSFARLAKANRGTVARTRMGPVL